MSTFENPNSDLILPKEAEDLKKEGKMSQDEINNYNTRDSAPEKNEEGPGMGPNEVTEVELDDDVDPMVQTVKESSVAYIQDYNEEEHNAQQKKDNLAREAFRNWQGQQLYWTFFRFLSHDPKTKKTRWEKRTYRIRDLVNWQTQKIQEKFREIESLETRKHYLQYQAQRTLENLKSWITEDPGKAIDKALKDIEAMRMEFYFGETNRGIISEIRTQDLRDLIDAAIARENKLSLSRKRVSSATTSKENTTATTTKK